MNARPRHSFAAAILLLALAASQNHAAWATALPPPLEALSFGITAEEAHAALPQATRLAQGIAFGTLEAHLVLTDADAFGSRFRVYLQFDQARGLRQVLLERRHAAATRRTAVKVQDSLAQEFGPPDRVCLPVHTSPGAGRLTWYGGDWSMHLVGFDDLGAGIRTEDAERGEVLAPKSAERSRDERFRSRQQRSLPRRILIRIHQRGDAALLPPPCGVN